MPEAPRITANELKKRIETGEAFTIIDVRNPQAWAESAVSARDAVRLPLDQFERYLPRIPKNKPIVTFCT